jgi:thiamine biosynthesis lipoprotein
MRRLLVAGLAALALCGCGRAESPITLRLYAMETWVDLTLPQAATRRETDLIASIESELGQFGRDYYAWGDGELARLNQALSTSGRFEASPGMANLLQNAQRIAEASQGAFDPGVGPLVELWGFNDAEHPPTTPPTDAAIAARLAESGSIQDLVIEGNRIRAVEARRFTLDLGGIAKGDAVDRIIERLAGLGIAPALVNAGGDLRVLGEPPDRSWRIGVKAPRGDGLLGTIVLHGGEAAFTSGDYERYYDYEGRRLHHILDPRTGAPVAHTEAVTVLAADGRTADAAATALFVAGPEAWLETARELGIEAALRVDANGTIEMTRAMRDRFQPSAETGSDIIVAGH